MTGASSVRTTVKRLPERGHYDRESIEGILDASLICHIGFVADGQPFVIPTIHARVGDTIFLHGSPASRMLRDLKSGVRLCLTATVVDGLVLARSSFHHSLNYRSVVVLGEARPVTESDEKRGAMRAITNHVLAGRWDEAREPTDKELRGTQVLALDLDEASAKVRTGPPLDEREDYDLPVWAGVIPLTTAAGTPIPDPDLAADIPLPASVLAF